MRTIHGQQWSYYAPEKGAGAGGGAGAGAGGGAGAGDGAASGAGAAAGAAAGGDGAGKGAAQGGGAGAGAGKGAAGGEGEGGEGAGKGAGEGEGKAGDWAPDWRQKLAGDDAKALKQLERYASPKDVWNKARGLEARLSSGELRSNLPDKATPEQITAWRAENGIPEAPDKYTLALKDGLTIGKDDKPIVDAVLKVLHGVNATNAQASAMVDWYYEQTEAMAAARAQKDAEYAQKGSDELHGEWGKEYRLNMNKIEGLLATMPKDVVDLFKHGRLANQDPILANPQVLRALNGWARTINPVSTLVPNSGGDISVAIDGEIKQIEGWMKSPKGSPDYKKYWNDNGTQERYRELLDGRDRAKAQGAAAR